MGFLFVWGKPIGFCELHFTILSAQCHDLLAPLPCFGKRLSLRLDHPSVCVPFESVLCCLVVILHSHGLDHKTVSCFVSFPLFFVGLVFFSDEKKSYAFEFPWFSFPPSELEVRVKYWRAGCHHLFDLWLSVMCHSTPSLSPTTLLPSPLLPQIVENRTESH